MKCAYSSNIGAKRKVNQDACLAATIENSGRKYYVFAVADGLGGHRSGEIASQMAVDYIKKSCQMSKIILTMTKCTILSMRSITRLLM